MSSLSTPLRRQLEEAVKKGRRVATAGARKALEGLAVHEPDPYLHMNAGQRDLRRKLQAQAKQLGDGESASRKGRYEIKHLAEKLAYDQWHRILFARYLLENSLLISPDHGVSVSLDDCEELAPSLRLKDAWAVAARFAAKELPEIFRADDPAGAVDFAVEDRKPMIDLVTGLPLEVFTAKDSLGWCYQFWQAERKDEVNASGNKIGADELPAVTQLFTEDYMVDFLLDNTLGAWHAGKVLAANPELALKASREEELREAVALPGCRWAYLRFIQTEQGAWTPAAGTFDGWPKAAKDLKCLDPCMGSGHFVVAMFERMVALRLAEEGSDQMAAVAAVVRDNLFGLEIDPRCTQIGAFNLALSAWRKVGHCRLPAMNIACSGLAPNTTREDWLKLAADAPSLRFQFGALYDLFEKAPVLGSLINPRADKAVTFGAALYELQPLLEEALAEGTRDDSAHEMAVTAQGVAKAAEILAAQFTLVATNVPYLGRKKQIGLLMDFCDRVHTAARADLATCFVERCLSFCPEGGTIALVTPQNWLFLGGYKSLRRRALEEYEWAYVARLGAHAFETIGGEIVNVSLVSLSRRLPRKAHRFASLDVAQRTTPVEKGDALFGEQVAVLAQGDQLLNPDARISTAEKGVDMPALGDYAECYQGVVTGDLERFRVQFWEISDTAKTWQPFRTTIDAPNAFDGLNAAIRWQGGAGELHEYAAATRDQLHDMHESGNRAWKRQGVAINRMGDLLAAAYLGEIFDNNVAVVIPRETRDLPAVLAFCSSPTFVDLVRSLDQTIKVTNRTLIKVPFDLGHWATVAANSPNVLAKVFSSDPKQWLFNGRPDGADHPLQVAVARLLGHRWPRQTGSSFLDCPALGPDGLEELVDDDGIVPISPTKGEGPAAERLRELLAHAYGKDWSAARQDELVAQVGYAGASLEDWLRNGFFEQHCALFHHRPFIWHIWDGAKGGFSALVNYHLLMDANLEKLTYSYLGDWIRRQQAAVEAGESGSDKRLEAAKRLQARLKMILEGEPPFDIFVRWKPLSTQAMGWRPDINDGVRMNIRPFMAEDIPGGKKGAGILRSKPNIKWEKDRGKEPQRDKKEFPWFWSWDGEKQDFAGGRDFDGNRWNDCHYSNAVKQAARTPRK